MFSVGEVARVRFFFCADSGRGHFPPNDLTVISSGEIHMLFGRRCRRGGSFRRVVSIEPGIALSRRFPSGKFWVTSYSFLSGNLLCERYEIVTCVCYRRDKYYRGFVPCNTVVFEASVRDYQKAIQVCGRRILDQLPTELKRELFRGFF